jgi:hypothetical protein
MIHKLTVKMAHYGRAAGVQFSNVFYIQSPDAFNSAVVLAASNNVINAMKAAALDYVHFMSARIREELTDTNELASGRYRTLQLAGVGARALGLDEPAPNGVALIVTRNMSEGQDGELRFRGFLKASDLGPYTGNGGSVTTPATFSSLIASLNGPLTNASLVLPASKLKAGEPSRAIVSHALGGFRQFQLRAIRESLERDEVKLAQRKVNAANARIAKLMRAAGTENLFGQFLVQARAIAQAVLTIINTLSVLTRPQITIPAKLALIIAGLA